LPRCWSPLAAERRRSTAPHPYQNRYGGRGDDDEDAQQGSVGQHGRGGGAVEDKGHRGLPGAKRKSNPRAGSQSGHAQKAGNRTAYSGANTGADRCSPARPALRPQDKATGNYPIHIAAQNGHRHIVKMLLDAGANVNAQNNNGLTALHMSVEYDYYFTSKVLVDAGADGEMVSGEVSCSLLRAGRACPRA
jgi:ankyrin repeat protein